MGQKLTFLKQCATLKNQTLTAFTNLWWHIWSQILHVNKLSWRLNLPKIPNFHPSCFEEQWRRQQRCSAIKFAAADGREDLLTGSAGDRSLSLRTEHIFLLTTYWTRIHSNKVDFLREPSNLRLIKSLKQRAVIKGFKSKFDF